MSFGQAIRSRAAVARRRIVFPECTDPRVAEAVRILARHGVVEPVAVVATAEDRERLTPILGGVEIVDASSSPLSDGLARQLVHVRGVKGMTEVEATRLSRTPLYLADHLVAEGHADGCVAGAIHTTGDVVRAAIFVVGSRPGCSTISSAFYMECAPFRGTAGPEVLTFTDCAVVQSPTAAQLADIALSAAEDRRRIVGDVPVVAFLSFSTRGSAAGPSVQRVTEAVGLLRGRAPDLAVDGELQGDAALIAAVGKHKSPGSTVAGKANVLVFPSLDAGNIAYKLVQRLAGASAIGPILQGLRRPCNDLSRGAEVDDIVNVAAITALQCDNAASMPFVGSRKESTT